MGKCVTTLVKSVSGQTYPLGVTSCGQVCYYCQVDLWSDVAPAETSCGQVCYYFGQADLWSDIAPMITLWVQLTFSQASIQADLWSDIPPTPETSCSQMCYCFC